MKNKISIFLFLFVPLLALLVFVEAENGTGELNGQTVLTKEKTSKIESWIEKNMEKGKIPGISVVIVEGDKTIYNKGFGYADIKAKQPVTSETLFELGSNSKAFTALGILKLEKEGRINLNDAVTQYIPWFKMKYVGEYRGAYIDDFVTITLEQLLHHTSGIPFKSIGDIPAAVGDDALEKTVRTQVGKELDFYPGEKFLYATINYDILGLVLQNVSGESFEEYMKRNILEPLELGNTYTSRNETPPFAMAKGYKVRFLMPEEYEAPVYRGNTPAGYFIANAVDVAKWIKIQLGTLEVNGVYRELIDISHTPDRTVAPNYDGSSYACGWSAIQDGGGMLVHGGSNPNYSSYILFRPQEKVGIGVLANLNSSYTEAIAKGIINVISGEKQNENTSDTYISIDNVLFMIVLISISVALVTIYFLLATIIQIFKGERKYGGNRKKTVVTIFSLLALLTGLGYSMYRIPDVLYYGLPWAFIKVWAPNSLPVAILSLMSAATIFFVYYTIATSFPKNNDRSFFIITVLSVASGFGNALIIFVINEALNRNDGFQTGLLIFFVMGIVIYVYGQRLVRTRLLILTNNLVYSKRMHLINRILSATYEKIESFENGKILAGLNNDTENISNFANIIITASTSIVTLACCFVYLGIINFYGLLVSILVIFIAAGLYFIVGRYANRLWEQTRDIQNVFFKFINSLINGFKELKINVKRQLEFTDDMQASCEEYRDKRIKGDLGFANVFVIGELLFTLVIGVVAFVFPILFEDIQISSLRNYTFVFLYMTGPVHGVLNSIPQLIGIRISYRRLNALIKELESMEMPEANIAANEPDGNQFELYLADVEYSYKNDNGESFKVGPINCSFKSGEITFITGGNGSGKSTLAKLVTGLYSPDKGDIFLNNRKANPEDLRQKYSAIFSDYYLFEKLYGINYKTKAAKITELLRMLHIDDKLSIDNGILSTIMLSTGQRKRLALLVSYLEDRPAYLFDEWAADQDPEFRHFFYYNLLVELKKRGKCIIAITHDDRFFKIADKVIKMNTGQIVENEDIFIKSNNQIGLVNA